MSRRSTSLNNYTATAINREIGSKYDNVKIVADNIDALTSLATILDTGTVDEAIALFTAELQADISTVADISTHITTVADNEADINTLATNIDAITNVADNMVDILAAVDTITNLTASATSTAHFNEASASLVGSDIQIVVPKGVPGNDGVDGLTPVISFTYNTETGDLEYEVTDYIPSTETEPTEEW